MENDIPTIITAALVTSRQKYEPFPTWQSGFSALEKKLDDLDRASILLDEDEVRVRLAQVAAICIRMIEAIK